jgi:hypothetical protein
MKNIKIECGWDLEFDLFHEKQLELWVDKNPTPGKQEGVVRIGILIEPPEIRGAMGLQTFLDRFDFILTHDQSIIASNEKAYLYEFGGCWVRDYNFGDKKFGVSTLIGGKKMVHGHNLRSQVFNRSREITIPKNIWISKNFPPSDKGSGNPILSGSKSDMFNTQFHICIENVKRDNWFTEKLLDCLYTKTIPIYYGCPNIGEWFDTRGFIMVDNTTEVIEACNRLDSGYYEKHLEFVEENFKRVKNYMDVSENIKRSIEKNILPLIG